jgi:hypothetical protein
VIACRREMSISFPKDTPESDTQSAGASRPHTDEPGRRGTVYLAWDSELNFYWGYWDQSPDGPPRNLEQCPPSPSLRTVVEWGRARARRVIIRPEWHPEEYYWVGVGDPEGEFAELPRLQDV